MATKIIFQPVILKQVTFKNLNKKFYRIHRNDSEFVDIEADTAYEAILISKIEKPTFVELKVNRLGNFVYDSKELQIDNSEKK